MPCYNEQDHIAAKIEALKNQLPSNIAYELLIFSDGSDDDTNSILEAYKKDERIEIFIQPTRSGKPKALNFLVSKAKYPILLFSDTRQSLGDHCISLLLSDMTDPSIGASSAMLVHSNNNSVFRKWINKVKELESIAGSTIGSYGCFYMIRKNLYQDLPSDLILDDLYTPIHIIGQSYRVIMNPLAMVYDRSFPDMYQSGRMNRINKGLVQILGLKNGPISKLPFQYKLAFFFQKFGKFLIPLLLIFQYLLLLLLAILGYYKTPIIVETGLLCMVLLLGFVFGIKMLKEIVHIFLRYLKTLPSLLARKQDILWEKMK